MDLGEPSFRHKSLPTLVVEQGPCPGEGCRYSFEIESTILQSSHRLALSEETFSQIFFPAHVALVSLVL